MEDPKPEEWIKYQRYATHNLPDHLKKYLEYQSKLSSGILTRAYFTKMAKFSLNNQQK